MHLLSILAAALLTGCGGGQAPEETAACDLNLDTLVGRTFVMQEAQPDGKTYKENPITRLRFVQEDGALKAKYTVGSLSDVYDYECSILEKGGNRELFCAEKERPTDWCQALEVHEAGSCTKAKLRELGIRKHTDEELNAAIKEAKETVKKYRGTEHWNHFVLNNNNLGNKLQGRLYVGVDEKRCRLSITDMYFTIFDGRGIEDTNPVGKNPFVETKEDLLFTHCEDGRWLADLTTATVPEDLSTIPPRREHAVGGEVYYHYLGEKAVKAEEGCTYSYDTFAQFRPLQSGVTVQPGEGGTLAWSFVHKYTPLELLTYSGQQVGVLHMIRHKECNGQKEKIDVLCNAAILK